MFSVIALPCSALLGSILPCVDLHYLLGVCLGLVGSIYGFIIGE